MSQVDRAIVGESARWGDNRRSQPYTRQDWLNTQNAKLTNFFPTRTNQVLGWLKSANLYPSVEAPEFHVNGQPQHGGPMAARAPLSMTPAGTIWYSLDGSDPRLAGGGVSSTALRYTGPVALSKSAQVKARALSGTTWSALNEAVFAVGPVAQGLRVSEIMYHPLDDGNPGDPNTEFVELTNIANQSINLNLVRFAEGIHYAFPEFDLPPAGYCLIVKDLAAFEARYGNKLPAVGQYAGSLDNGGERVELVDAAGQIIQSFRYEDNWYKSTDGQGFSLTVTDPKTSDANSLSDKAAWQPSAEKGGSPGRDK
jgi:hypothetical protein